MPKKPTVIDLFAGAGGMTRGFVDAGFKPVLAVEKEPDFAATYAENFGKHIVADDIVEFCKTAEIPKVDVVIGGPPCQGFSNLTGNKKCDPRREMWRYFMDVVEKSECQVFVIENVPNLLKSDEGENIVKFARKLGYHIDGETCGILNAADFGVPQNRRRAILIGSRIDYLNLPAPNGEFSTVRDAFKGIPKRPTFQELAETPVTTPQLHIARNPTEKSLARYRLIPPGGNRFDLQRLAPELTPDCWIRKTKGGTDLFGRLHWDGPARCTIRTEFYKPEKGRYLHPKEDRPITHWEAARLQTFPDEFKWHGTKIRIAIQIGNAVPPVFAKALANHIKKHLRGESRELTDDERQLRLVREKSPVFETKKRKQVTSKC
ncbi:DNA cytosine methyltransferase [Neorhodopirellula lusitana]|uniref:DNA cytosine methyltransferase n=1 Tax=Neorhodopirellula lusitana TaxID=445327 RepID=UPI00384CE3B7